MPSVLTAVAQTDTSTPDYPDGYVGAKSTFQDLVDARAFMTGTLPTFIDWSGDFSVVGSAPNNFTVTYGAISAVTLYASNIYKPFSSAGGTATQANVAGGTLGVAANLWYVYAFNNAGTLDIEISTTAPNASRTLKTGDATRRFLGAFPTDSSGVPIALAGTGGRYTFRQQQQVLTTGVATAATTVSVAAYVPAYARMATIALKLNRGTDASNRAAYLYGAGSGSYVTMQVDATNLGAANYVVWGRADVELDSSRRFAYSIDSAAGSASADAFITGWWE